MIVPALVLLTGLPMAQAVATSLVVISVVACTGFATFLPGSPLPWSLLLQVAGGGLVGMLAGTLLGKQVAGPLLQRLFAVLMLVMAGLSLLHVLH